MRRLSGFELVILILSLLCAVPISSRGQERKSDIDNILSGFPGHHLLTLNERDSDTRAFVLQHFPKANPSVVRADFDGDGHLDYALQFRNDRSQETKLVVLLCSEDAHCRSVYELDVSAYSDSVYLRPVTRRSSVSQTEALGTNRTASVNLKSTGIRVTYFEKGQVVLYWNKKLKKIVELQTQD